MPCIPTGCQALTPLAAYSYNNGMKLIRLLAILSLAAASFADPSIVIRNNHELDYFGLLTFKTTQPDGFYKGKSGYATVNGGVGRGVVMIGGASELSLAKTPARFIEGPFSISPGWGGVTLEWNGRTVGNIDFGLVVIPGRTATWQQVEFKPLAMRFDKKFDGTLVGKCHYREYEISITLTPYPGGWMDADATITRVMDGPADEYLALARRITMPTTGIRTRWDGAVADGLPQSDAPNHLAHGLDWCSWKSGGLSLALVNQFSPGYTIERQPGRWVAANHFYTWERVKQQDNDLYFISEIAGPNPAQESSGTRGLRAYTPPLKSEAHKLGFRLAISTEPQREDSLLLGYAGYRKVTMTGETAAVDIGVPYVEFGTSYFPYSTMTANFDFYRTAGLDREGWWPFSPKMWEKWPSFRFYFDTDLRIIRAMGFDWVRLHHLELLGKMDRSNALAFLDFYMGTAKKLGMRVLVDTAGSPEWMTLIMERYNDVVKLVELENEVLIPGITSGEPERWTAQYNAVKKVAPETEVFLTGAGNQGMFDRLIRLNVPFDRVGVHNYKHGPGNEVAIPSLALAWSSQATDFNKPVVLGEFNWKFLTEYSPEARAKEFAAIYGNMLQPRAIPSFFQFHWQETLSVNPRLTRQGLRHYETINLDRTPKPEAIEFMKLIRRYANPQSPLRELPIQIEDGKFTVINATKRPLEVALSTESYQGLKLGSIKSDKLTLKPGESRSGRIELLLHPRSAVGVYHYFLRADYEGKSSYGWGMLSKPGSPTFNRPNLGVLVDYPQGMEIITKFDYSRPICVAFGAKNPIVEMEMAYLVRNTLQVVIGQPVRLCAVADIPKDFRGNLILVGTPESNPLIGKPQLSDKATVLLQDGNLLLTGKTSDGVRAAATDFVLRYWTNARDSSCRISGLEKGAALGNKAAPGDVNLP